MGFPSGGKSNLPSEEVNWFETVKECKHPVPVDLANLMYCMAWLHAPSCVHGDYLRAVGHVRLQLLEYQKMNLSLIYVID